MYKKIIIEVLIKRKRMCWYTAILYYFLCPVFLAHKSHKRTRTRKIRARERIIMTIIIIIVNAVCIRVAIPMPDASDALKIGTCILWARTQQGAAIRAISTKPCGTGRIAPGRIAVIDAYNSC